MRTWSSALHVISGARWFSSLAASSWGTPVFSSPRDRLPPWLLAALSSGATIPPGLAVLIGRRFPFAGWYRSNGVLRLEKLDQFLIEGPELNDRVPQTAPPPHVPAQTSSGSEMLRRALAQAHWTLFWERLSPPLARLATLVSTKVMVVPSPTSVSSRRCSSMVCPAGT